MLPVRDTVLFPHAVLPLTIGRESSIELIRSLGEEKIIVVVAQRDSQMENPQPVGPLRGRDPGDHPQGHPDAE